MDGLTGAGGLCDARMPWVMEASLRWSDSVGVICRVSTAVAIAQLDGNGFIRSERVSSYWKCGPQLCRVPTHASILVWAYATARGAELERLTFRTVIAACLVNIGESQR